MAAGNLNRPRLQLAIIGPDRRYGPIGAHDRFAVWIAATAPLLGLGVVALAAALTGF